MYYALNEANKASIDDLFSMAMGTINAATGMKKSNNADNYSYSSIAKASSKLAAIFPILTSRTVSMETAEMVSRFVEQKACQFFMSALQQANISNAKSGIEYLQRYHQNLDIGGTGMDTIIKSMQIWMDAYNAGKGVHESSVSFNMINDKNADGYYDYVLEADDIELSPKDIKELMEYMASMQDVQVYDEDLNPMSVNDFTVREFADGRYNVSIRNYNPLNEAGKGGLRDDYKNQANNPNFDPVYDLDDKYQSRRQAAYQNQSDEDAQYEYDKRKQSDDEHKTDRERLDTKYNREEDQRKYDIAARERSGGNITVLKDQDIKKMNDAMPSILTVKFYQAKDASVATTFIIGVKARLIPITTSEILRRIMNDNKDGKKFLKFMRLITGELKKSEFLLGLSRIYDDVKSCKVKGAYGDVWNLLKNRAEAAKEQVKHGQRNDYSAITTVLISKADAEELYREENLDIEDPKNALHFMQSYNLMGFAIADDATESLKIMFDDDSRIFDEHSYSMLEREQKDGTYKKLINLMSGVK